MMETVPNSIEATVCTECGCKYGSNSDRFMPCPICNPASQVIDLRAEVLRLKGERLRLLGYISTTLDHCNQRPDVVIEWWESTDKALEGE